MNTIFWDLDDTLLETLPGRMRALAHAYEQCMGCRTDPEALWRSHRGGSLESLGERLLGADGHIFANLYRKHYYSTRKLADAYPGVVEVLAESVASGFRHAVVTSKTAWCATEELGEAGLLGFFEAVVGSDDTDCHKPDPEPIYTAMERLCIDDPSKILFVGDSPADIWAARNAGCRSVAALWGTLDKGLVLDAMPDFQAAAPCDIQGILQQVLCP
jgi:HAD superfamily hydrolase (TIGR01549 family)